MPNRIWDTRGPVEPGFETAWNAVLATTTHAHFELDLRFLRWEAAHGHHSVAALLDDGSRSGAIVLRRHGQGFRSGWPWRWSMVLANPTDPGPVGMTPSDVDWIVEQASAIVGFQRLECYVPELTDAHASEFVAGATLLRSVVMSDEALLASMDGDKRRAVQRAKREGFEVVESPEIEGMRAFARLQIEADHRRGIEASEQADPAPGEAHREWELPWMWLLVAGREGCVEAGSGFGRYPGAHVDYRANASTEVAKKLGANALLAYEAMRRSRDQGYRWINWCGATRFKMDLGGAQYPVRCRLAGGWPWAVPNVLESSGRRIRAALGRAVREQKTARRESSKGKRPAATSPPKA